MSNPTDPGTATYVWMSLVALCGSVMRAAQWVDATGKLLWWKLVLEIPTAVVLAVIAGSIGAYWNLQPAVTFGIAGLFGLIGPAAVVGLVQMRFGNIINAGAKPNPSSAHD